MTSAFKLAVYAYTPAWLAGIFLLVPGLHFLVMLGLYGLFLLFKGMPDADAHAAPRTHFCLPARLPSARWSSSLIVGVVARDGFFAAGNSVTRCRVDDLRRERKLPAAGRQVGQRQRRLWLRWNRRRLRKQNGIAEPPVEFVPAAIAGTGPDPAACSPSRPPDSGFGRGSDSRAPTSAAPWRAMRANPALRGTVAFLIAALTKIRSTCGSSAAARMTASVAGGPHRGIDLAPACRRPSWSPTFPRVPAATTRDSASASARCRRRARPDGWRGRSASGRRAAATYRRTAVPATEATLVDFLRQPFKQRDELADVPSCGCATAASPARCRR